MPSLKAILKIIYAYLHLILTLISPLFILLFVVGVIMLLDAYNHYRLLLQLLDQDSRLALATVSQAYDPEFGKATVQYVQAGQAGQVAWGYLEADYFPPGYVASLQVGQELQIRYPLTPRESLVVPEALYPRLHRSFYFALPHLGILAVSWLLIILYPEFLYFGYSQEFFEHAFQNKVTAP